jgi:hypothetical protein
MREGTGGCEEFLYRIKAGPAGGRLRAAVLGRCTNGGSNQILLGSLTRLPSFVEPNGGLAKMSPLRRELRQRFSQYQKALGPAKLYLDDLEDIIRLVEESSKQAFQAPPPAMPATGPKTALWKARGLRTKIGLWLMKPPKVKGVNLPPPSPPFTFRAVTLSAGNALADSPDDLKDATSQDLKSIQIAGASVNIVLSPSWAYAQATSFYGNVSDLARSIVDDVERFVRQHRIWLARGRASDMLFEAAIIVTGLFLVLLAAASGTAYGYVWSVGFGLAALLTIFLTQRSLRRNGSVVVIAQRRNEARGLSMNTRRSLFIGLAGTLFGALATAVGKILADRFGT